jgi:hypothetical protein
MPDIFILFSYVFAFDVNFNGIGAEYASWVCPLAIGVESHCTNGSGKCPSRDSFAPFTLKHNNFITTVKRGEVGGLKEHVISKAIGFNQSELL